MRPLNFFEVVGELEWCRSSLTSRHGSAGPVKMNRQARAGISPGSMWPARPCPPDGLPGGPAGHCRHLLIATGNGPTFRHRGI